ncbi:RNA-directed DNA polymerase, eukaryota [Tanacetum coccineum]
MASRVNSYADLTRAISKSIFISNLPDNTSAKDLWNLCQSYGTVVDVFIPNRRTKSGLRFAFVRFIKVINIDRLVGNLCTLWIGRNHLHANLARFERPLVKPAQKAPPVRQAHNAASFVSAVKGNLSCPPSDVPAMVLDESCVVDHDFSLSVMGEVHDFVSINNLKVMLLSEGFSTEKISYLGGLWVLLEFNSNKTRSKFMKHVGVNSWFKRLSDVQPDFVPRERVVWVDIKVIVCAWSNNGHVFIGIGSRWGEVLNLNDSCGEFCTRKRLCIMTKQEDNILEKFKIIVKRKVFVVRAKELFVWTPNFVMPDSVTDDELNKEDIDVHIVRSTEGRTYKENSVQKEVSSDPFNIYELLHKHNKDVNTDGISSSIPFPPGYTPENVRSHVDVQEVQEDPIESVDNTRGCNSQAVESSQYEEGQFRPKLHGRHGSGINNNEGGSILPLLEDMINVGKTMGFNLAGCAKDMEKIIRECIVMGDFNEVRRKEERWGSIFDAHGSRYFNNFIDHAGLVEIQLEGFSFTWSHVSAAKMSKLDRFLVSDGVFSLFPHVSAICLDRNLSDHRPILLREVCVDYGPTPFRFYHSWFELQGFDLFITQTWEDIQLDDKNDLVRFKKKLQTLKKAIRVWVNTQKSSQSASVHELKSKLNLIDSKIDKGDVNADLLVTQLESSVHGYFNKKRANLAVKGVMVDGDWVDDPIRVKEEFHDYFATRFCETEPSSGYIDFNFPNKISGDQLADIESPISNDEILWLRWKLHESIRRNFFNGIREGERKIAWVKWSKVLAPKSQGGLGVSSYYALNRGLLAKWIWRFISRDNSLWYRVIQAIHGPSMDDISVTYPSLWKSIIREMDTLKHQGMDFISHCKLRVGNGTSTSFWKDMWLGNSRLCMEYPRLFALENDKDCKVATKLHGPFESSFRRNVRGGIESSQLSHILGDLESVVLSNAEDRWVWDLNGEGSFRVKDARSLIDEFLLPNSNTETRWVKVVPIKVNIFAWKVSLDRLPTCSNLMKRGVMVSPSSCPVCRNVIEDVDHLFFQCILAQEINRGICIWWNLGKASFDSYASWLQWFSNIRMRSNSKRALEGVFYTMWWSIWAARNQILFEAASPRFETLFIDIVRRSFSWCNARGKTAVSWDSWLKHPHLIIL